MVVSATHAFVDGIVQAAGKTFEAHAHADFEKHIHDAGVLANRAVAGGAHFAVGQDLRDRVFGGSALLALVGARQVSNVVSRVVIADVLQRGCDGFNQIVLCNAGHKNALFQSENSMAIVLMLDSPGLIQQLVGISNRHGAEQKSNMNNGLPNQYFFVVVGGVDECFQQMNR